MNRSPSLNDVLKKRFHIYSYTVLSFILVTMSYHLISSLNDMMLRQQEKTDTLANVINSAVEFGDVDTIKEFTDKLNFHDKVEFFTVVSESNDIIFTAGSKTHSILIGELLLHHSVGINMIDTASIIKNNVGKEIGELHVGYKTDELKYKLFIDLFVFIIFIIFLWFISELSIKKIIGRIYRPLDQLTKAIIEISTNSNLSIRIDQQYGKQIEELELLVKSFNGLIENLEMSNKELNSKKDEIDDLNKSLEIKVEKKTLILNKTIQDLKDYQEKLVAQEKLASMGSLVAGIAHEIKNPLNIIHNCTKLIMEFFEDDLIPYLKQNNLDEKNDLSKCFYEDLEFSKQSATMVVENSERVDLIVNNMLAQTRSSEYKFKKENVSEILKEAYNLSYHSMCIKHELNMTLDLDFGENVPDVNAIYIDLSRAFVNLFENSFYALARKVESSDETFRPTLKVKLSVLKDTINIIIEDNGTGIDMNILEEVFNPFFTTKPAGDGTGLGLSMVHDIIVSHNAEISVASVDGESTKFDINFLTGNKYDEWR